MSDSECEFMLSQVSGNMDYSNTQSASYGVDIIDSDEDMNQVVSLENGNQKIEVEVNGRSDMRGRVLYDNVYIEDISSDDELENL